MRKTFHKKSRNLIYYDFKKNYNSILNLRAKKMRFLLNLSDGHTDRRTDISNYRVPLQLILSLNINNITAYSFEI